jgi:hypothetical protein
LFLARDLLLCAKHLFVDASRPDWAVRPVFQARAISAPTSAPLSLPRSRWRVGYKPILGPRSGKGDDRSLPRRAGGDEAADDKSLARNNKSLHGNLGYMRLNSAGDL